MKRIEVIFYPLMSVLLVFIDGIKQDKRYINMDSWEYFGYDENEDIAIQLEEDNGDTILSLYLQSNDHTRELNTICAWSTNSSRSIIGDPTTESITIVNSIEEVNEIIKRKRIENTETQDVTFLTFGDSETK